MLLLLVINRVPLNYTLRNLTVRWRTTLMTALAFTLVVGLMVVMLAFTTGMQRMIDGHFGESRQRNGPLRRGRRRVVQQYRRGATPQK